MTDRNPIYERDNWQCRHCKDRNALHPHHIVYRSHGGTDDPNNLITICAQCHNALHDGDLLMTRISMTETDSVVHFTRLNGWKPK